MGATNYLLRHPDRVTLDYGADICLSLFGMRPRHFNFDFETSETSTLLFHKPVCLAHGNGFGQSKRLLADLENAL